MRPDFKCQLVSSASTIVLTDLFYSYGYNPESDGPLAVNFVNLIAKNPASVFPELNFTVTTFDKYDGNLSAVDSKVVLLKDFFKAGTLKNLTISFDNSTSNYKTAVAFIKFAVNHVPTGAKSIISVRFPEVFNVSSQTAVMAKSGFVTLKPVFRFVEPGTVEIDNLASLTTGTVVEVQLSPVGMPRYQGKVDSAVTVALSDGQSLQLIDEAPFTYFVAQATTWDDL